MPRLDADGEQVITFKPDGQVHPVHKELIAQALDNLNEWLVSEEPENLKHTLRCLKVLQLYSADMEP